MPEKPKDKIRILRIINRFNIGGPTFNATFLTRFISDEYETMLVGGLPEGDESDSLHIPESYGVQPILIEELVRNPSVSSDRKAYKRLKEIIKEFDPHIVHTHASKAGALGRKAAAASKVPVIVHTFHGHIFHSYFGKVKTRLFKEIERNLAKKSDAIISISERQREELCHVHKVCKMENTHVIPLGFDLQPFHDKRMAGRAAKREEFGLTDDTIAIAIVGRFAPIKNHDLFFDAIGKVLSKTKKKLKVFVVGDGAERENIESRAAELNKKFPGVIELTSWITDIASFNAAIDLICLTSNNEGTPVSLIEAQAACIPVISTDVGGVRDIVKDGDTGFIVPVNDAHLFAEKVLELVENEKKRQKMSQNGWTFVKDTFHYNTLAANMDRLYKELLEKKQVNV
ncbi:MAG: glycosyltransferase family 4 protein [Crocinitomicaceae bacterium]